MECSCRILIHVNDATSNGGSLCQFVVSNTSLCPSPSLCLSADIPLVFLLISSLSLCCYQKLPVNWLSVTTTWWCLFADKDMYWHIMDLRKAISLARLGFKSWYPPPLFFTVCAVNTFECSALISHSHSLFMSYNWYISLILSGLIADCYYTLTFFIT